MYNYIRRGLIVSVKFHRKFLTQSIHKDISSHVTDYHNNTCWSNALLYKRFCCQAPVEEKENQININGKDNSQQKLDEFLSDPANQKLFHILELEVDVLRHNADQVPNNITPKNWLMLVKMTTKSQRRKYLRFLFLNEKSQEHQKAKKELKKNEALAKKTEIEQKEDTGEMQYGLAYNTLFLRIYETTINRFYQGKLLQAMMYEPKIVFDCDYENHMTQREIHDCAKQLILSFASNRIHANPMFLYYCNLKEDGMLKLLMNTIMPNILDDDFPAIITSQSYLDLFPRDQLVYLTPHSRRDLTEYDPNMVYIIGGLVDKTDPKPLSLAKAKKEGIQMAKLPLEKYLSWGSGSSKNLTLDQMLRIILDIRHTKDWKKALQHVPTRKLKEFREYMLQAKLKKSFKKTQRYNISNSDTEIQTDFTFANRKSNN